MEDKTVLCSHGACGGLQYSSPRQHMLGEASVTPPGSAPSHRVGLEPGMLAREAGALPRSLKATASSVSRQSTSF